MFRPINTIVDKSYWKIRIVHCLWTWLNIHTHTHTALTLILSSSSSPSHLFNLAPPTMPIGAMGLVGSKLSASETSRHTFNGPPLFERYAYIARSFTVDGNFYTKVITRSHPTPWSRASLENVFRRAWGKSRGAIRLSEWVDVDSRQRESRTARFVFSRRSVLPILRVKHNTNGRKFVKNVYVSREPTQIRRFGVLAKFYRYQPMDSVIITGGRRPCDSVGKSRSPERRPAHCVAASLSLVRGQYSDSSIGTSFLSFEFRPPTFAQFINGRQFSTPATRLAPRFSQILKAHTTNKGANGTIRPPRFNPSNPFGSTSHARWSLGTPG